MLNFLTRLFRRPAVDLDDPLVIRDLFDHPALRPLLESDDTADEPSSLGWTRLAASGPIRFEQVAHDDLAA